MQREAQGLNGFHYHRQRDRGQWQERQRMKNTTQISCDFVNVLLRRLCSRPQLKRTSTVK